MKYITSKREGDFALFRYHTTWNLSWEELVDIMQVFLDDISEEVHLAEYFLVAGAPAKPIGSIPKGYLRNVDALKEETGGVSLAGVSRFMKIPIRLTIYNQLREVDIQVKLINKEISKEFEDNPRFLETYLDSIEINGYSKHSKRIGMRLVQNFVKTIENRGDNGSVDAENTSFDYFRTCDDLGIEPNFYGSK